MAGPGPIPQRTKIRGHAPLRPIMAAGRFAARTMRQWGDRYAAPAGPPLQMVHDECGNVADAVMTCSCCGEPIGASNVTTVTGSQAVSGVAGAGVSSRTISGSGPARSSGAAGA